MIHRSFATLSGLMLCLSGAAYILDTALDALAPGSSPGLGALVPVLGLVGFPGFWLSLRGGVPSALSLAAYGMGMLGLAGLVAVTFLGNRVFADLPPQTVGEVAAVIGPEFLLIGVTFLVSAFLLVPVCWTSGIFNRFGAVLYAAGAIPVSLPPLMPEGLVAAGGVAVGTGLLIWGGTLIGGKAGR